MRDELIVRYCSPTLAGIRTGNVFVHVYCSKPEAMNEIYMFNRKLVPKGLCAIPIRYMGNKMLIYIFRPDMLKKDLFQPSSYRFLKMCGYRCKSMAGCITDLISRLENYTQFPHEIGLFLGYPVEDVIGFINNHGYNYKYMGLWKVYSNEMQCRMLFAAYKKCTDDYSQKWLAGMSIEQLTVAVSYINPDKTLDTEQICPF